MGHAPAPSFAYAQPRPAASGPFPAKEMTRARHRSRGHPVGDEGKGKLTDLLAGQMDVVVRYQGDHNAGHTIVVGEQHFAVRLVPAASCTRER